MLWGEVNLDFGYKNNGLLNRLNFAGLINKAVNFHYESYSELQSVELEGGGGAAGGLIAPGAHGVSFGGNYMWQLAQRGVAGIPGASLSGAIALLGKILGSPNNEAQENCP